MHPHLYDRLLSAGVTPDFARPAPPSSVRPRLVALTSLGFVVVLFFGWRVGWVVAPSRDARLLVAAMAVTGGDAHDIFDLAWEREYAGDDAGALPLYELAAQTDTDRAYFAVNLSSAYAKAGRCAEAATWAHDAEQRLARTRDASDADAVPTAWDWVARCDAGTR